MRIPSSFTEDNLYSRQNRRTRGPSPHRRLMRLVLAMILVIAVMRQAGNPRVYEVFFPASVAPPVSKAPVAIARNDSATSVAQVAQGPIAPTAADTLDGNFLARLQKMLAILGDERNAELMKSLATIRGGKVDDADSARHDPSKTASQPSDNAPAFEHTGWPESWRDQLNAAFLEAAGESGESDRPAAEKPPDWGNSFTVVHLQNALDRWAIARVDPSAIWKASDVLGFYRLLEKDTNHFGDAFASRTSVTSLVQQPDVYLHRRVVLPASVARVILRTAAKNPFGVDQYWEVWLRPRDGSERPLVAFTSEVSAEIAAIPADATLSDGPMVWIDGVFLKRIAYQSSLGRELAPAIVGTLRQPETSPSLSDAASSESPEGWVLVFVSAAIGFSAAAVIFLSSGKGIIRSRQLRQKTVPAAPPFLVHFDDPSHRSQTGESSS